MIKKDVYIILGASGCGKTAQVMLLANKFNLFPISWDKTIKGKDLKSKQSKLFGKSLDSDNIKRAELISEVIESEIKLFLDKPNKKGLVISGYPRRRIEAELLMALIKKNNLQLKCLININTNLEIIQERVRLQKKDQKCENVHDKTSQAEMKRKHENNDALSVKENSSTIEVKNDFLNFIKENPETFDYLKKYSDLYFTVGGNDDETNIFSTIILKIKHGVKEGYSLHERRGQAQLRTKYGLFTIVAYQSRVDYSYHLALIKGEVEGASGVLTRVHSSCITGDIFFSKKCDCGSQLRASMKEIDRIGRGLIIYLFQEGRGINIINKINAYALQQDGFDTVQANEELGFPAEMRHYQVVKDIISDMKILSIKLLTNNPDKLNKLADLGVSVEEMVPLVIEPNKFNKKYLKTKQVKMDHKLSF